MNKILFLSFFTAALILAACTDPTVIGGELLGNNQLPVSYRDDIPLKMTTLRSDTNQLSTSIQDSEDLVAVGCISSAYTGTLNSRVGIQLVERAIQLDLSEATIDSIVLVLPLDTTFQIGDTTATSSIRVLGATAESFTDLEPVLTTSLEDNGVVYGETTVVPSRTSGPTNVFTEGVLRVDTLGPELRVRLNQSFRDAFLPAVDSSSLRDTIMDDLFVIDFPGIIVEGGSCGGTLPAIDLSTNRINRMGVFVYYTEMDSLRQYQYNYRRENVSVGVLRPEYVHDFSGSPAESLLDEDPLQETLAIVQSLGGLMVKVEFTDLSGLDNQAVNAAFLDVPLVPGTNEVIRALPRILPKIVNSEGDLIDYSARATDGTSAFSELEGGSLFKMQDPSGSVTDSVLAYRFNLTTFFQEVLEGTRDPEIYLVGRFETLLPGESILVGPGGGANALRSRLLLATTQLP